MSGKRSKKSGKHLSIRADGRYCAWYDGKAFYGKTEAEAYDKRDAYKDSVRQGRTLDREVLSRYAERWLKIAKTDCSERTKAQYQALIRRLCAELGNIKIADVLPSDIQSVLAGLSRYSKSYIHKADMIYRALFQSAVRDRIILTNPADGLQVPRGTSGGHRCILDWERALIWSVPHRCRLAALVMLYAGLRRGEVLALTRESIRDGHFVVYESVQYVGNAPTLHGCKNATSRRIVPIFDIIQPEIEKFLRTGQEYVLPSASGRMCTETAFTRAWKSYMVALSDAYNGEGKRWYQKHEHSAPYRQVMFGCHDLRYTFTSDARDAGIELNVLRRWLGHSSERMILQVYDHVRPEREESEKMLLNQHYSSQKTSQGSEPSPQSLTDQRSQTPPCLTTNQKVVGSNPAGLTEENGSDQ